MTNTLPVTQAIQNDFAQFVNADGAVGTTLTNNPSNSKLLMTAGANGCIVKSLMVTSDDTSARVLVLYLSPDAGTNKWPIGSLSIGITAGATGAVAGADLLGTIVIPGFPVDQSGRSVIELGPALRIYVGVQVAVTAAKFLTVSCTSEQF